MLKIAVAFLIVVFISCSIARSIGKPQYIKSLITFANTIKKQYPQSEIRQPILRISDTALKDSLKRFNISTFSVIYSNDTMNRKGYYYGNLTKLPDSCIIFERESRLFDEDKITSTLLIMLSVYQVVAIKIPQLQLSTKAEY